MVIEPKLMGKRQGDIELRILADICSLSAIFNPLEIHVSKVMLYGHHHRLNLTRLSREERVKRARKGVWMKEELATPHYTLCKRILAMIAAAYFYERIEINYETPQ